MDKDVLPFSLLSHLKQSGLADQPSVREVKRLACELAAKNALAFEAFEALVREHTASKPPPYNRKTWRALNMHKNCGFHNYVCEFTGSLP